MSKNQYQGSLQSYDSICDQNVMVTARDGIKLATDIYFPASNETKVIGKFPVILERTPYDKSSPANVYKAKFFARRGYICAIQDVRGRFQSGGIWYPFAKEANDGFDTVEWLGTQSWSDGKVGTMGDSYAGSDQSALATLNPPHLSTMIVAVGASNYFHSSMRQNGALEQRFHIYTFRMAANSKEAESNPAIKKHLQKIWPHGLREIINTFPVRKGSTILRELPNYEQWAVDILTNVKYDDYWKQRGYAINEYIEEHADVPSLYLGGWYDTYPRNTIQNFLDFSATKVSDQRLLMGPWTHGEYEVTYAGDSDFGIESHINYNDLKLSWFDHYLKDMDTEASSWSEVKFFTMGTGDGNIDYEGRLRRGGYWRTSSEWPLKSTEYKEFYLDRNGRLTSEILDLDNESYSTYTFDPKNPVPTIGGSLSAAAPWLCPGAFDQRGDPDRFIGSSNKLPLNSRDDVLTFQTEELEIDTEVTGPINVKLWIASSAKDTDFTVKLIDLFPSTDEYVEGLAINITDSIMRTRFRNGWEKEELMEPGTPYLIEFDLFPTSNIFKTGHRIRIDISSSNWPRFDVNNNTGGKIGIDKSYICAEQTIYHNQIMPSSIILPIQPHRHLILPDPSMGHIGSPTGI